MKATYIVHRFCGHSRLYSAWRALCWAWREHRRECAKLTREDWV